MESFDLIIVGAGPAGLSTAMHLIQADPTWADRLLVLEKAAHPRPKLCGGGVTRLGLRVLADLGLLHPLPLAHVPVHRVRIRYGDREVTLHGREGHPQFVIFCRPEFDAFLAETARARGVRIRENEAVREVVFDGDGVRLTTTRGVYRAQAVVGADGSKGITRRLLQGRGRTARLLEVIHPAPAEADLFTHHEVIFDFTPACQALQGYVWDFPSRVDGAPAFNRGVYDARVGRRRPRAALPGLLRDWLRLRGDAPEAPRVQGHPIHWFSPGNRLSAPRLLLVGDAAGVDSLFGEGIAPALAYGRVAAEVVQRAFQKGDFSFAGYRRRVLTSFLGRYLLWRWLVAWWAYRLSGLNWYMHVLWSVGTILAWLFNRERWDG